MITQKMIAEKAGVSYATVSRAFTNSAKVNSETLMKIKKAMTELGINNMEDFFYGFKKSDNVLVILGDICNQFYAHILAGIYRILNSIGYNVVICNSRYDVETEKEALIKAREQRYAGVIMLTVEDSDDVKELLIRVRIPVVFVNRYIPTLDMDVVRIDNYRGGYIAAQYLIDKGHKKIAHLGGPKNSSTTKDRLRGFLNAINDNGLHMDKKDIVFGNQSRVAGKEFADRIIKSDYTAIYVGNDYMAAGAVHRLLKNNRLIPDDISVICFDDSHIIDENGLDITSVSFDPEIMGEAAAKLLINRINDPLGMPVKSVYSPVLKERNSVKQI